MFPNCWGQRFNKLILNFWRKILPVLPRIFDVIFQVRVGVLPPISRYRETSWKTRRSRVFLTSFEVSRNRRKNTKRVFEITSQTNHYFRRKSSRKLEKFSCNLPPISKYWLIMYFFVFSSWIINEFEKWRWSTASYLARSAMSSIKFPLLNDESPSPCPLNLRFCFATKRTILRSLVSSWRFLESLFFFCFAASFEIWLIMLLLDTKFL